MILLQWSYDNFAYSRRQSLKNIYENCSAFADGQIDKKEFKERLENYFRFTPSSSAFDYIAENSKDFKKWFEVFYQVDPNEVTVELIKRRQLEAIRDNLSRFLESYRKNMGLDFISGMVRLMLDDYNNIDGQNRLESSLGQVKAFESENLNLFLKNLFKLGVILPINQRNKLVESIHRVFQDDLLLRKINDVFEDDYSQLTIIEQNSKKLQPLINRIHEGIKKIG